MSSVEFNRRFPLAMNLPHECKAAMNSLFAFKAALNSWGSFMGRGARPVQKLIYARLGFGTFFEL